MLPHCGLSGAAGGSAGISSEGARMRLDEACLLVYNTDPTHTLELWGQSLECYTCSFWQLATLPPHSNTSLVVNSTYTTLMSVMGGEQHLYGLRAHFVEHGTYSLSLTQATHRLDTLSATRYQYLPVAMALLFFAMLFTMWQFARCLRSKMESSGRSTSPESTPILGRTTTQSSTRSYGTGAPTSTTTKSPVPIDSIPSTSHGTTTTSTSTSTTTSPVPPPQCSPPPITSSTRLRSLDTFRGLAIFLMIFVNYGGGSYSFFKHSPWNGLTVADLVFPWFLWIMGVSLVFSVQSQLRRNVSRIRIFMKICKRAVVLFALGIMVNGISNRDVSLLRVPGVLQRFAICYLVCAGLEAFCLPRPVPAPAHATADQVEMGRRWWGAVEDLVGSWMQWVVVVGMVAVHTALTYVMLVPGCPRGYTGPGGLHDYGAHSNCTGGAASYIDEVILGYAHLYQHSTAKNVYQNTAIHDPEGVLGTLTSVLMVQLGVAAGRVLLTHERHSGRILRFLAWAACCGLMGGMLCDFSKEFGVVAVNKNLWSLSYVLVTACFAFVLFALIYAAVDAKEYWNGNPLRYAGLNSILLYVGHELTKKVFPFSWLPAPQTHAGLLLMNLWGSVLWLIIAWLCHSSRIYVKV